MPRAPPSEAPITTNKTMAVCHRGAIKRPVWRICEAVKVRSDESGSNLTPSYNVRFASSGQEQEYGSHGRSRHRIGRTNADWQVSGIVVGSLSAATGRDRGARGCETRGRRSGASLGMHHG